MTCLQQAGEAIKREKKIKAGSRKKKIELINKHNKEWKDLSSFISGDCFADALN
jgi:putative endonuclease